MFSKIDNKQLTYIHVQEKKYRCFTAQEKV